jgi:hypothetical protein
MCFIYLLPLNYQVTINVNSGFSSTAIVLAELVLFRRAGRASNRANQRQLAVVLVVTFKRYTATRTSGMTQADPAAASVATISKTSGLMFFYHVISHRSI